MTNQHELFDRYRLLASQVQNLNAIIQNADCPVTMSYLKEWLEVAEQTTANLQSLTRETLAFVVGKLEVINDDGNNSISGTRDNHRGSDGGI
jgi:hypothetical protein